MAPRRAPGAARPWFGWRPDHSAPCDLDRDVAALILRTGKETLPHGTVGALRSLGRAGIACSVVSNELSRVEACSRYLQEHIVLAARGTEQPKELAKVLVEATRHLPGRPVLVANDDEAAVVLAEASEVLAPWFRLPPVPADLPRRLASKWGLHQLCLEHGTPTLPCWYPCEGHELFQIAAEVGFPLVVKNAVPFLRLRGATAPATTIVRDAGQLARVAAERGDGAEVVVQAYLPDQYAEDWIVHGYRDSQGRLAVLFTGRKLLSWPPNSGATARGRVETNQELATLARTFCERVDYRGIFDMDWRLDRRDGQYKLLDFNPRIGAQHRLFENAQGVDVLRAFHLDLSNRPVPSGAAREGEELMVENLEAAARLAIWRASRGRAEGASSLAPQGPIEPARMAQGRLAWFARDDPRPFFAMAGQQVRQFRDARRRR